MDRFVSATQEAITVRKAPWSTRGPDTIVIHTMEGSYEGSVRWARYSRKERAESFLRRRGGTLEGWLASSVTFPTAAHYYFSQFGDCTQMVQDWQKCYHANDFNSRSIGFEHEGRANVNNFTDAMLMKSAACAGALCARYSIPVTRERIVGHSEVPGATHRDPGVYWPWERYMNMVDDALTRSKR